MDKKSFLNLIQFEDKNLLSNIYDKIKLSEKIADSVFTNEFCTPNLWKAIVNLKEEFGTNVYTYGIFDECERRVLAFSKEEVNYYPVKLVKITNKSRFEVLSHRDFLGAIMGLGIKREKFGDLVVKDNICYGAFFEDIYDYVLYNLNFIGRCPCEVELIEEWNPLEIRANREALSIITTSLRLDCIVGSICNISRSKAVDIINSGKVLLDYAQAIEKNETVEFDSMITIRGYGKFKILEQVGSTQKGRLKLNVSKYM